MKLRLTSFALLIALFSAFMLAPIGASAATQDKNFLKNLPVRGTIVGAGGSFNGKLTITKVGYTESGGFNVSGVLKGTARKANGSVVEVTKSFTALKATLNESATSSASYTAQQASCQTLFLDLGPLFLDVLGLQVDLSQIVLDITAVSGAGNLLGNLLCGVANLLNPLGFLDTLIGSLTQLTNLLNQINTLFR